MSEDTVDMIRQALLGKDVTGMLDIRYAKVLVVIENGVVYVSEYEDEGEWWK